MDLKESIIKMRLFGCEVERRLNVLENMGNMADLVRTVVGMGRGLLLVVENLAALADRHDEELDVMTQLMREWERYVTDTDSRIGLLEAMAGISDAEVVEITAGGVRVRPPAVKRKPDENAPDEARQTYGPEGEGKTPGGSIIDRLLASRGTIKRGAPD
jgi:hypothetical protein